MSVGAFQANRGGRGQQSGSPIDILMLVKVKNNLQRL